jgi:hypothetical protein
MDMRHAEKAEDQYEEHVLTTVRPCANGGWEITHDGLTFFCPKDSPVEPKVGMKARFYGRGFGYPVRGLDIDGREVFYRTQAEEEVRHRKMVEDMKEKKRKDYEASRNEYDRRVATLPDVFQKRVEKFRNAGGDEWRHEFEPYELFTCEEAVKIAAHCKTTEGVVAFHDLPWEEQKKAGISDDHSGNTFGMACRLAHWYLKAPENVTKEHGALVGLVGCDGYSCKH